MKQDCKGKAVVRNSGLGHYYIYLTSLDNIFTARSSDLEMDEVCGTKAKYDGCTEHIDGKLYNYCIRGWGVNQKSSQQKLTAHLQGGTGENIMLSTVLTGNSVLFSEGLIFLCNLGLVPEK
ncbi:hypothetical protein MN033_10250 [Bacillus nitratireducens]|uniref:hypothetical protein n=1 Tax=Bacillus nitratireducens TaxID=2026193 RepID=UPI001F57F9E2|nr:hypothetical protein [Bacillus nitratireducens]UNP78498.1 hypothetical protein MN033_10250 [Bacillus nitratireducens]